MPQLNKFGQDPRRPDGGAEVRSILEYWLDLARKGRLHHVALAAVNTDDQIGYHYGGTLGLEDRAQDALRSMWLELDAIQQARRLPPRDTSLGANFVEYPFFAGAPVNHDFLIWLVDAKMTMIRERAPPPLRVHFSHAELLDETGLNFLENVFRPMLPLLGVMEDSIAKGGRHKPLYVPQDIVVASRSGEPVPRLDASPRAHYQTELFLRGRRPVTITTREAPHSPQRNSNMAAWLKFAQHLQAKGEEVVFVRDAYQATQAMPPGLCSYPAASWVPDLRVALYQHARCNMLVANGPCGYGFFIPAPYIYFVNTERDLSYAPANASWWQRANGIAEGEQWPWALPHQRLVWQRDSYENICAAWEAMEPQLRTAPDPPPYRADPQELWRAAIA
jgi:hypothetical protein